MRFLKTMTSFLRNPKPAGRNRPSRPTPRLGVESLDRRDVPTTLFGNALADAFVVQADPVTALPQVVRNGSVVFTGIPTNNEIILNTGGGNDTIEINATFAGIQTVVNAGANDDTISITPAGQTLDALDGPVTVNGGSDSDILIVNDQLNIFNDTFELTGTSVDRDFAEAITHGTVEDVVLHGGSGAVTYNVAGTAAGVETVINGGSGKDAFVVAPVGQFLDTLDGTLTVNGGGAADTLTVHDESNPNDDDFVVTGTSVDRNFASPIHYSSIGGGVVIEGGSGDLTFDVESTSAGNPVTINDNSYGTTNFVVSPAAKDLATIAGRLTLAGVSGANFIEVHDENSPAASTYTLSMDALERTGAARITADFDNMPLVLHGGQGDSVFEVTEEPFLTSFTLIGGAGADTVEGPDEANVFEITGVNRGEVNYAFGNLYFQEVESLTGGALADTFEFQAGSLGGVINGGVGVDEIDYSNVLFGITASLFDGTAELTGGVTGIENLTGGAGDDIFIGNGVNNVFVGNGGDDVLVGGAGDDVLTGDIGFDILIGGLGADDLGGGLGGDVVIGGSTIFGNDDVILASLMDEWQSANAYNARVNNLRLGGGANGANVLASAAGAGQTVIVDDGAPDVLAGGGGADWFFFAGVDPAPALAPGEQVN